MRFKLAITLLLSTALASAWDRQKGIDYLEAKQVQWAGWKPAQKDGGPCVSCHTGVPYLIAAPHWNAAPGKAQKEYAAGVATRILANPPKSMGVEPGTEAILNLLTLSLQRKDRKAPLTDADRAALEQLWGKQIQEGDNKGAWTWINVKLNPVESEFSNYFGAALAEKALASYPAAEAKGAASLRDFLKRKAAGQPLHNRLAAAAFSFADDKAFRLGVVKDLWTAQEGDGGFTSKSMGPWTTREGAPPDTGSNAYSTAWAAFTAHQAGVKCSDPNLKRALDWLKSHQDPATGGWQSVSMNKQYKDGSMQQQFMTDAATGYALAAMASCKVN